MSKVPRHAGVWLACATIAAASTIPGRAEVGVAFGELGRANTYILQIIVDDPEPVGNAWIPYSNGSSGRVVLNAGGFENGDGDPSLIMRPAPLYPVAAWALNTPSGYDVVVSAFDGVAWTSPQVVAGGPVDELDPHLVLDPNDGSVHLLYWIHDISPRVIHRQAPGDLSSWSAPVEVSLPGEVACRPSGIFHDGQLHVIYELHGLGYGTTPRQIVVAKQDGDGFVSQILATTEYPGDNWPQLHSAGGRLWFDWVDSSCEAGWRLQIAPGSWEPVETQGYATTEERDYHVRGEIRQQVLD